MIKNAVHPKDYPEADRPEVALVGRSNSGKSSLINSLLGRKDSYVSKTPGKTRLINFFDKGDRYRIVDMPGYGFAARAIDEINQWTSMIETYFSTRSNLVGLILTMDVRRDWSDDEEMLYRLSLDLGKKFALVLTKIDKLSRAELDKRSAYFRRRIKGECFFISSLSGQGVKEFEEQMFHQWIGSK
jgi:GTP-binding protein